MNAPADYAGIICLRRATNLSNLALLKPKRNLAMQGIFKESESNLDTNKTSLQKSQTPYFFTFPQKLTWGVTYL